MKPDDLDELIRRCDPAGHEDGSGGADSDRLLLESTQQWAELSKRRVVVRRRFSMALAAIAVFAIVGIGASMVDGWRNRPGVRLVDSEQEVDRLDSPEIAISDATVEDEHAPRETRMPKSSATPMDLATESTRVAVEARPKPLRKPRHRRIPVRRSSRGQFELQEFLGIVNNAGDIGGDRWLASVNQLKQLPPQAQRVSVSMVPEIRDAKLRAHAIDLVCDAAGNSKQSVLLTWLADKTVRSVAWNRLVADASLSQAAELIKFAATDRERRELCRHVSRLPDEWSVGMLVGLAGDAAWRSSVKDASSELGGAQIRSLILMMRQPDLAVRTSAAFVLASVPGQQVDQVVCSMIANGKYQQPAYMVLLSRDTPLSRAFLARAAVRPELTAALVSARMHFANIEQQLHRWIRDSQGAKDESSDTTKRFVPQGINVDRHAGVAGSTGNLS